MSKIKLRLEAQVVTKLDESVYLRFKNPAHYRQQVSQFKGKKKIWVTLEEQKSTRSLGMNAYWHGICFPILAELMCMTQAECKKVVSTMFIISYVKEVQGVEYEIRKGTSDLTRGEGVEFTDSLIQLAAELGGVIKVPCEVGYSCSWKFCEVCTGGYQDEI